MNGRGVDDVVIIERQHGGIGGGVKVVHHADQNLVGREAAVRIHQRQRLHTQARVGGPKSRNDMSQEA